MTKTLSVLDKARHDAQNLHKKVTADIAKAEAATWADVKATQADAHALVASMKSLAQDQSDAVKAGIAASVARLEAAEHLVETKATAGKDDVKRANAALLESARKAAQSLSQAVADLRTKAAHALEPKKVHA